MANGNKVDLTGLAYKAGFNNVYDAICVSSSRWPNVIRALNSSQFEMIYFLTRNEDRVVEVFGVREQIDSESCALFRVEVDRLDDSLLLYEMPERYKGVSLEKSTLLHRGQTAVDVLESYARQLDEESTPYGWWIRREEAVQDE